MIKCYTLKSTFTNADKCKKKKKEKSVTLSIFTFLFHLDRLSQLTLWYMVTKDWPEKIERMSVGEGGRIFSCKVPSLT